MLRICEQFYSLQGEGSRVLRPTYFIRFAGCNLQCSFCDEPLHTSGGAEKSEEEIVGEIPSHVVAVSLTGGEPLLQYLVPLCWHLHEREIDIQLETNGSVGFRKAGNLPGSFNFISVSPKEGAPFDKEVMAVADEIKLLVDEENVARVVQYAKELAAALVVVQIFLQPINHTKEISWPNLKACVKAVKEHPFLRLSVQVHKLLKIR